MLSPTQLLEAPGAALPTTWKGRMVLQDGSKQLLSLVTCPCQLKLIVQVQLGQENCLPHDALRNGSVVLKKLG